MLSSCSGFLDSEPITTITDVNYYKTVSDAEAALIGCYAGLQKVYNSGDIPLPILSEVCSDNTFGATGFTDDYKYQVIDNFDKDAAAGLVNILESSYEYYYKGLYRCNMLLSKLDQIDWEGDEDYRNEVETETRFIRAYLFFDMARIWERVPLKLDTESGNTPQATAEEIYAQIASDLKFAVDSGSTSINQGHSNKYVAQSLLARVYLFYTGYYNKTSMTTTEGEIISKDYVLKGLEDVIAGGSYSLVSEYKTLWPAASAVFDAKTNTIDRSAFAGVYNSEIVFSIKYNITSDYNGNTDGNQWLVMLGVRNNGYVPPYGQGWGACTVLPSLYQAYQDIDTRRDASIINLASEYTDFDNSGQREHTGYMNKKYTTLSGVKEDGTYDDWAVINGAVDFQIGQFQDYYVMRYADVLLMAAELGSSKAQTYFDLVRTRAGLPSIAVSKDNIMAERRLEFAFEGLRFYDLLRQGVDVAASAVAVNTKVENGGSSETKIITAAKLQTTKGFQQIPANVITRSGGVITQNAGW